MIVRFFVKNGLILLLTLVIALGAFGGHVQLARATSPPVSTISISPLQTCCGGPDMPLQSPGYFSVNVNVNIVSGESVQGFDVRVNYTNPPMVIRSSAINYSSNIFASYSNSGPVVQCRDGISDISNAAGCAGEVVGQVHFAESILGSGLSGPISGTLFTMTFQVASQGNSTFVFDRADITNPNPDPSNPQFTHFTYIPLLEYAGIFGNKGAVAFFNYQPVDTSVSLSLLPNQPVLFDASPSFVANDSSLGFKLYSWNFGDNTLNTGVQVRHSFVLPGNYTVSLTVTDNKNENGTLSRRVSVMPALGSLDLTVEDHSGNPQRANVIVMLYNSSSSTVPFENKTIGQNGDVRFSQLTPKDGYYLTFSGQGLVSTSVTEKIIPGWTTMDTVYMSIVPSPPDYGGIIYGGTILAGLAAIAIAIVYQRRKAARGSGKGRSRSTKGNKKGMQSK
jgi:PKD repeat protein